ncbi:MAG: Asp-tRNA(Asn)/Glu-tRNA(Gln) amidotransferase subunit GatC [Candidatus Omnitrophica bacterium]|nr:Asp-tRNA(Asn)/Glu-tRNA(Gln) amidotransferase subunit GatC [Candidatus Omnitrophota bacterium]
MSITKDKIIYVAKLARIRLDEKNLDHFTSQLDKILSYMEKLNQLNTDDTAQTSHVMGLSNVFRPDENTASLSNEEALSNAPEQENGHFKVPKII